MNSGTHKQKIIENNMQMKCMLEIIATRACCLNIYKSRAVQMSNLTKYI